MVPNNEDIVDIEPVAYFPRHLHNRGEDCFLYLIKTRQNIDYMVIYSMNEDRGMILKSCEQI